MTENNINPDTIYYKKMDILRQFAKRIPNCQTVSVDWGRAKLTAWFDGIHSKEFDIENIFSAFKRTAEQKHPNCVILLK